MELLRYLVVLRNRWKMIAVTVIVAVAAAWFLSPRTELYKATSSIYVGSRTVDFTNAGDVAFSLAAADRFVQTFATMIDSETVAALAVDRTRVDKSAAAVVAETSVSHVENTQLLAIQVLDENPTVALRLANGLADAFVDEVQTFEPGDTGGEGAVPSLPAYIFERARLPVTPEPTGLGIDLAVAAILGFALGVGFALLLDYLDLTARSIEDAERRLELPVLGAIPDFGPGMPARASSQPRWQPLRMSG